MMEHKRSPCSVEQSSLTSLASKRQKADLSAKVSLSPFPLFSIFQLEYGFLLQVMQSQSEAV